jgi:hypothetical protein
MDKEKLADTNNRCMSIIINDTQSEIPSPYIPLPISRSVSGLLFNFDNLPEDFNGFPTFPACNTNPFSEGFRFLFMRVPPVSSVRESIAT